MLDIKEEEDGLGPAATDTERFADLDVEVLAT